MMDQEDTSLEALRQRIVETKERIARHEVFLAELTDKQRQGLEQPEALFRSFKDVLRFAREDLEMLEAKLHRLTSGKTS